MPAVSESGTDGLFGLSDTSGTLLCHPEVLLEMLMWTHIDFKST